MHIVTAQKFHPFKNYHQSCVCIHRPALEGSSFCHAHAPIYDFCGPPSSRAPLSHDVICPFMNEFFATFMTFYNSVMMDVSGMIYQILITFELLPTFIADIFIVMKQIHYYGCI